MYNNPRDGSATITIGAPTAMVLRGEDDVTQWDDEELAFGRRRNIKGRFDGPRPKLIPAACLRELNRRKLYETESVIRDACADAARYLAGVAQGTEKPNAARQSAANSVLDRFLGKPVDRVQMNADVELKEPLWMQVFRRAVQVDGVPVDEIPAVRQAMGYPSASPEPDDDIIDAEVVEESSLSKRCQRGAHSTCPECDCSCHFDPVLEDDEDDDIVWED